MRSATYDADIEKMYGTADADLTFTETAGKIKLSNSGYGYSYYPTGLDSLARLVQGLFSKGEQGVWFDPPDISTLYQDAAGTTPVTAMEQPVGLMLDKSKGLVLGTPLTISSVDVTPLGGTAVDNGDGTYTVSGGGYVRFYYNLADLKQGAFYKVEVEVLSGTGSYLLQWCDEGGTIKTGAGVVSVIATRVYDSTYRFVDFEGCSTNDVTFKLLSVRELPGNHCTFKAGTGRPVLSAKYNLLTYTEQFDNAAWVKGNASIDVVKVAAPNSTLTAQKLVENTANTTHQMYVVAAMPTVSNTFSIYAKAAGRSKIYFGGNWVLTDALIDLETGAVSGVGASRIKTTLAANGWWRIESTGTPTDTTSRSYVVRLHNGTSDTYTGDGTSGIYIWGADLRPTNDGIGLPTYQRVVDSATYDTAGFPVYLRADGTDDGGSTNSIDFTGTDKVTVFAGVRKLSDAAKGIVAEFSATTVSNNGTYALTAPNAASATYGFESKGTALTDAIASATAPISSVISASGGISTDSNVIRVNGTQSDSDTGDQGTGNYGNYPLFLFARNNSSLYFNGRLYGLIVLGRAATATEIANTERYLNQRGRIY